MAVEEEGRAPAAAKEEGAVRRKVGPQLLRKRRVQLWL